MKILFDQGTPAPMRRFLPGPVIATAFEQGWSGFQNGNLIDAAEKSGFEVLITTDHNLKYQQNLEGRNLGHTGASNHKLAKISKPFGSHFNSGKPAEAGRLSRIGFQRLIPARVSPSPTVQSTSNHIAYHARQNHDRMR